MANILIADDHDNIRVVLKQHLKSAGHTVTEAADGRAAVNLLTEETQVAIIDLQMPELTGLEVLEEARRRFPTLPVIILSAVGTMNDALSAMRDGAFWYLAKPFDRQELLELVSKAEELKELKTERAELQAAVSSPLTALSIVAESAAMKECLTHLIQIADLDATVLFTGESGTGKTTLARYLHQHSGRKGEPFVSLSCAAFPRDLLEAELFGHERGAYTGAVSSRPGCIEVAKRGTIFLDEIADLPLELQPKLLTFLQDRTFRRLGSTKERRSEARVLCATNIDLDARVREKLFREELYYRINVIAIEVPPLRERKQDLRPLALSMVERISEKSGRKQSLSEEALAAIEGYRWPGNIRELENVLERSCAFAHDGEIQRADLKFGNEVVKTAALKTLEEIERDAVLQTLERCDGNKVEAARILGLSLKSIYNKLSRYGEK